MDAGDETYEYTTTLLSGRLRGDGPERLAEQVNTVAREGWRLVQVADNIAYFERRQRAG